MSLFLFVFYFFIYFLPKMKGGKMELKHIMTMVRQRRSKRGLKYSPTYDYKTGWTTTGRQLDLIALKHRLGLYRK